MLSLFSMLSKGDFQKSYNAPVIDGNSKTVGKSNGRTGKMPVLLMFNGPHKHLMTEQRKT